MPLGIDVASGIKKDGIKDLECIQCGVCIDNCSRNVLSYGIIERKEKDNGNGKKAWLCNFRSIKSRRIDTTLKCFWGASYGSIYPTLSDLVNRGLATKREDEGDKRNK